MRMRIAFLVALLYLSGAVVAQAQSLPVATPEQVGLSTERLNKITATLRGRCREGGHSGSDPAGWSPRQGRLVRRGRRARSGDQGPDDEGLDLPHLLDEQADHLGGGDDALRGRQVLSGRPRLEVHPAAGRPQGGRREARSQRRQAHPRAGAGPARHDHPGSLSPHLGPDLRLLRQGPREEDVRRDEGLERLPLERRAGRPARQAAARLSAGHHVGLQPLDRRARASSSR